MATSISVQPAENNGSLSARSARSGAGLSPRSPRSPLGSPRGCPFEEFGCQYGDAKKNVQKHVKKYPVQHLSYLTDGVRDFTNDLMSFQLDMERQDRRLEALQYRVRELDVIFSTQIVWRINNYKKCLREAKMGKKITIFSPPFYSGKQGYKMAASANLYGDGPVKGKQMSVFVTLLQSDWDSLLAWPFSCSVTFTVIDQKEQADARVNISQTFKPNTCKENRPFVGRPIGDRNPSFGIQKFVDLAVLDSEDYLKDDTLFLQIDINTVDVLAV